LKREINTPGAKRLPAFSLSSTWLVLTDRPTVDFLPEFSSALI